MFLDSWELGELAEQHFRAAPQNRCRAGATEVCRFSLRRVPLAALAGNFP